MTQEITDLQTAQTANANAIQAATTAIASLVSRNAELHGQVATLTAQVADAAQIPPVTAAMMTSTQALEAALATVPTP